jgi:hypothetical protein
MNNFHIQKVFKDGELVVDGDREGGVLTLLNASRYVNDCKFLNTTKNQFRKRKLIWYAEGGICMLRSFSLKEAPLKSIFCNFR